MLRVAIEAKTPLGIKAKETMEKNSYSSNSQSSVCQDAKIYFLASIHRFVLKYEGSIDEVNQIAQVVNQGVVNQGLTKQHTILVWVAELSISQDLHMKEDIHRRLKLKFVT